MGLLYLLPLPFGVFFQRLVGTKEVKDFPVFFFLWLPEVQSVTTFKRMAL
jgi:hypothetical protein